MRSTEQLKHIVRTVLDEWDCGSYFVMLNSHERGGATIYPHKQIVSVSEELLSWPTPAIVAMALHEVGHLVLGHRLAEHDDMLLNHIDEFEADEFAFDALRTRYGYVHSTAGLFLLRLAGTWRWDYDCHTHPSAEHRWERLAWNGFVPDNHQFTFQALGLEQPKEYI